MSSPASKPNAGEHGYSWEAEEWTHLGTVSTQHEGSAIRATTHQVKYKEQLGNSVRRQDNLSNTTTYTKVRSHPTD